MMSTVRHLTVVAATAAVLLGISACSPEPEPPAAPPQGFTADQHDPFTRLWVTEPKRTTDSCGGALATDCWEVLVHPDGTCASVTMRLVERNASDGRLSDTMKYFNTPEGETTRFVWDSEWFNKEALDRIEVEEIHCNNG